MTAEDANGKIVGKCDDNSSFDLRANLRPLYTGKLHRLDEADLIIHLENESFRRRGT
jgi:hypothetical protein